ncbi:hypothetical protein PV797_09250 [Clostridiaceae bacterium M8S5]|nr:hypothetical protein PV797_09250 [Clostridiaceae bacterium M8S5]
MKKRFLLLFSILIFVALICIGCTNKCPTWIVLNDDSIINLNSAIKGDLKIIKYKELSNYFESILHKDCFIQEISSDGQYIWISHGDNKEQTIYNMANNKIEIQGLENDISQYIEKNEEFLKDKFSHFLIYRYIHIDDYCKRIFERISNTLYSPNKRYMAKGIEDEDNNYFINIIDINKKKIIDKIYIGETGVFYGYPLYISQWHKTGYIVYTFEHKAYKYDVRTKKIIELGKYIFYPSITKDEKYMIYSKPIYDTCERDLDCFVDYNETGIYIRNLETGTDTNILKNKESDFYNIILGKLINTQVDYEKILENGGSHE